MKQKFMDIIKQSLSDVDRQGSSKRVLTYALFLVMVAMIAFVAFHVTTYDAISAMWKDLVMIFMVLIGAITSEKFTGRGKNQYGLPDNPKDQRLQEELQDLPQNIK